MPVVAQLDALLNTGFSSGTGSSSLVPGPFDVAINGHPYVVDLSFKPWKREAFRHRSIDQLRAQADTSNVPSETSLNPNGLWRRTAESWHHGAGQVHFDRKNSDQYMFRSSKGVNVWTQWQATLLNDTVQILASVNTNLAFAVCGARLYVIDGQALKYTTALAGGATSWTTVTGTPAVTASSICSDGSNVYVAYGASGIYKSANNTGTAAQYVTSPIDAAAVVGFVMGRLMLGSANILYNIVASGVLPTALMTSNYAGGLFVGFAEGQSVLYAAMLAGDTSIIYRAGIATDGTALTAPIVASRLPSGENIRAIFGYVGGEIAVGSDKGWRFGSVTSVGDISLGPLVLTPAAVRCFAGWNRFIWYGYTTYDGVSSGLGCMDPSVFTQDSVPAYASDLMVTTQNAVLSTVVFGGLPCLAVSGLGFYSQAATLVANGTIDSGLISYDIVDNKVPVFVDVGQTMTIDGTVSTWLALDNGNFNLLGTTAAGDTFNEFQANQQLSHVMEIREILNLGTVSPILIRHTLRAVPAAVTPTDIICVIRLEPQVLSPSGAEQPQTPFAELDFLENLRQTKKVVTYQEGSRSMSVTVESIDWIPESISRDRTQWGGVCVTGLRTVV